MIFDRNRGDTSPDYVRKHAEEGALEHRRFEMEEKIRALENKPDEVIDKRCFISSCIYGIDASETRLLRSWRDDVLIKTVIGRIFIYA
ncbi:MAG TPA: hypothetical protein DEF07_01350 [Nitrosomonas sp.]|uniref:Uncharacterized protein n=1 Tax=Nitrosomonas mobilis TaxID=51642 RepID=A0A1G5SCW5_9PROT|nr:hypothetical protein [Nitrosomonas mobilis]SCZ85046.1 conserved hypothetical protein [Nitrosomonas mobilis]HBV20350.1 hypothetical protein [Nitrosomonas sp.]HNO75917.1 hypothetical protein [Nitrosomonas mobilis]